MNDRFRPVLDVYIWYLSLISGDEHNKLRVQAQNKHFMVITIGAFISALFVYSVLSSLLITPRITISVSIITSLVVFGLTMYYNTLPSYSNARQNQNSMIENSHQNDIQVRSLKIENWQTSNVLFITLFGTLLLIISISYEQEFHVFSSWSEIGVWGIFQLGAAIMLCFFIPGFALVHILSKKYTIGGILVVLLSYLLSILITGITGYISSLSFDSAISESKHLFIAVYLAILGFYLIYFLRHMIPIKLRIKNYLCKHFMSNAIMKYVKPRASELLVFGSLFMLVIVSTYVLYGGITIGDQWYHQGRALLFMTGSIREAVLSHAEERYYPPFQSALLASITALSGLPLVNTYASIAFLNATLIFSLYYFFRSWVPATMRKAALLACSLFALSGGFGWIYLLDAATNHSIISAHSSLQILQSLVGLDVVDPSNYVIPTAPDFSTALIYISLPAGFVLLGLVRTCVDTKFNIFIVTAISALGIISHYEFYLFIVIASLLPIIFKMKAKSSLYFSFLIAISLVYLLNVFTPGNFYTSLNILGIPPLFLTALFVTITWIIYYTSGYLWRFISTRSINISTLRISHYRNTKFNFVISMIIIFLVAYLYLLSFIILGQQSADTIMHQTSFGTVPWYIYPMRLGVAGLLGLVFILSYLFKSFEKQIFIFGIIIIVSLIAGPYYFESRFSKYVMIGIVGFASLLIYKILNRRLSNAKLPLANILIIGIIIPTSGISIYLFIGYNSLIIETHDYTNTLPRRHFPSDSELHLLELLHADTNIDSNRYNVIGFSNQYDRWRDGFMAKIPSFSGLPYDKLRQSPLALNASTLDALYNLLSYSDIKYIVMPKDSISGSSVITEPTRFISTQFKPIYEDNKFILLEVPTLVSTTSSSNAKVGLIYNQSDDLSPKIVTDSSLLQFDNSSFDIDWPQKWITAQQVNQSQVLTLLGAETDKGLTLWSNNITEDKEVNFVEAKFRIVSENQNKSNSVRVEWQEGGKQQYYAKLSNDGLELYEKSRDIKYRDTLLKNTEIEKKNWTWYTLRVENSDDKTNIYLNDVLKIQAPRIDKKIEPISKVGLYTKYSNVEFKPLRIATISDYSQNVSEGTKFYDYYYPLNLLSMAKSSYDVFTETDSSVFSKHAILVPSSLIYDNVTFTKYLDYVLKGGTLIVDHSQNNFSAIFNQLFSLTPNVGKEEPFVNVAGDKNQKVMVNISGLVNAINYTGSSDVDTIASYRNDKNKTIAPFIIEKNFPSRGKIILLNSKGYYDSISKSPIKYFSTLSNISQLIPVDIGKGVISQNTSAPSKGFIGRMEANGKVSLNSSSLSLDYEKDNPYLIKSSNIAIFNGTEYPITFENVSIKELKIAGDYLVNVNASGSLKIPNSASLGDYIGVDLPNDFNMTVRTSPTGFSHIELVAQNQSSIKSFIISNYSRVIFYNIKQDSPEKSVSFILKRPEIQIDGHIIFKNAAFDGFLNERGGVNLGIPLDLEGQLKTKFEHVDKFDQPYLNTTRTTYLTYLNTLSMNGSFNEDKDRLNLPGDIYYKTKNTEHETPLKNALTSANNIITLIILIPLVIMIGKFIWSKQKL